MPRSSQGHGEGQDLKVEQQFCPTYLVGQALPMTASSSHPKLASPEQLEDTPRTGHLVQFSAASQVTKEDVRPSGSFSPDPSPFLPCKVESQHLSYPAWFPGTYTH